MAALSLPPSTIATIVDDPTILGARTSASSSTLSALNLSPETAQHILDAYVQGFRTVFILNASLNAVATVAAVLLIRHTELTRGDEVGLKQKAVLEQEKAEKAGMGEDEKRSMQLSQHSSLQTR